MSATEKHWVDPDGESSSRLIDENLRAGLAALWGAFICAHDTGASVWDFALRIERLYEVGMTSSDLRWMVAKGFAEHGKETSVYDDPHRTFHRSKGYFFNDRTCIILTPSGAALAEHVFGNTARSPQAKLSALVAVDGETAALANVQRASVVKNRPAMSGLRPRWDSTRRELSWAGLLVKRYRVPARNQERILGVFEEVGWTEHIEDPLPATYDIDAPTRLHDAINRLNKCQINPLLRFHGDGKGTGVLWALKHPDLMG